MGASETRFNAGELGAEAVARYEPGSMGCHELVDRSALAAKFVSETVLEHPACVLNEEWYALAERAVEALMDLYQKVGAEHLGAESLEPKTKDH